MWLFSSSEGLTSHFSDPEAFDSAVRSLGFAPRGQLLVGGDDGCLQLTLVRKRRRGGALELHEDHVTAITAVPDPSPRVHFLSASADHSLALWGREAGRWECRRHLRGHKAAVLSCAAHPTGRLALSVGADGTLRTWNLVRGRQAFVTRLGRKDVRPLEVLWSPDGHRYLILYPNRLECFAVTAANAPETSVAFESGGIAAAVFVAPQLCVVGCHERLCFVDLSSGAVLASLSVDEAEGKLKTEGRRVRCLRWDATERLLFILCRYSNGSSLHVLQLPQELLEKQAAVKLRSLCRTELANLRVTAFDACRFVCEANAEEKKGKMKQAVSDEEEEDDSELEEEDEDNEQEEDEDSEEQEEDEDNEQEEENDDSEEETLEKKAPPSKRRKTLKNKELRKGNVIKKKK